MNDKKRVRRFVPSWNGNKNCYAYPLFLPCFNRDSKDLNITLTRKYLKQGVLSPLFSLPIKEVEKPIPLYALGMPQIIQRDGKSESISLFSVCSNSLSSKDYFWANDNTAENSPILTSEQRQGQAIKSPLPCFYFVKEISNSVYGSPNNYIPVLKYPKKPSLRRIRRLQKTYSLGDIYLFQNHQEFVAISPKTTQKERLVKIYKKAGCWKSLSELEKFRQNWFYCSNIYDLKQRKKIETLRLLDILYSEADGFYSYPHTSFLKKYSNRNYPNLIGTKPKIYVAEFIGEESNRD